MKNSPLKPWLSFFMLMFIVPSIHAEPQKTSLPINHFKNYQSVEALYDQYQFYPYPALAFPLGKKLDSTHQKLKDELQQKISFILFARFFDQEAQTPLQSLETLLHQMDTEAQKDGLSGQLMDNAFAGILHRTLENLIFSHLRLMQFPLSHDEILWNEAIVKDSRGLLDLLAKQARFARQWERELSLSQFQDLPCLADLKPDQMSAPPFPTPPLRQCSQTMSLQEMVELSPSLKDYFSWEHSS